MKFVQAQLEQLGQIVQLYHDVVHTMHENGLFQWDESYPNREILQTDIEQGELFLLLDEEQIAGAVVLNQEEDPVYQTIPWQYNHNRFLVIHRLCVNPALQGKGIAKKLMNEIEAYAREQGYESIRLDTMIENKVAMKLYEGWGYERRGVFKFPVREEDFMSYEKKL